MGVGLPDEDEHYEMMSARVEALVKDGRAGSAGEYEELARQ